MKQKLLLFLILLASLIPLKAQIVKSYTINVEFFPKDAQMYNYPVSSESFMRANSTIQLSEITDSVVIFYLHGELKIDSVQSGNKNINYDFDKVLYNYDYSMIALKATVTSSDLVDENLTVFYSGFFNPSKAGALSNYMHINENSGVYLRGYGYSLWFPVFVEAGSNSYKSKFREITIKLPIGYKCIVGGELVKEKTDSVNYTAKWIPDFTDIMDIQCTARKFKLNMRDNVYVYYLTDRPSSEKVLEYAIELRELYSKNLKSIEESHPLFILEMPKYGDISSANVVGIQESIFNNFEEDIRSKLTIAHELVHPYVKIPVTKENPFYAFVIEGFPSFFQAYALKRIEGEKYNIDEVMIELENNYLEKRQTGKTRRGNVLPVEKAILNIKYDEIGKYKDRFVLRDRVWLFFYDIWNKMGDEKFDKFLKKLFAFNTINYKIFEELILNYLNDYKEKLNIWLNTTDYPEDIRIAH
jgi:hypothetical protein